ncbi:NUDIX domain-containing protein [Georgenia faecalis]|uniref:NUDIX domain-containing protein n=1 Tax=Georgenia faecalis TaxID=2483799 RepID=UPI000FDB70C4|nr:NUDIX domain-containing protein [Georgenia faecalis]
MARIDYYDDPKAPTPNSVVPAAVGCIIDPEGRILLEHRVDNDLWALPGGTHDFGESIVETVIREIREETGLEVEVVGLVGIYTDPRHVIAYSDGEVRQQFTLSFRCRLLGGSLAKDSESQELRWVRSLELDSLRIHPSMRKRIDHFFENRAEPYLG